MGACLFLGCFLSGSFFLSRFLRSSFLFSGSLFLRSCSCGGISLHFFLHAWLFLLRLCILLGRSLLGRSLLAQSNLCLDDFLLPLDVTFAATALFDFVMLLTHDV